MSVSNTFHLFADSTACWLLSPRPSGGIVWRGLNALSLRYVRLKLALSRRRHPSRPEAPPVSAICLFAALGEAANPRVPGLGDVISRNGFLKMLSEKYPAAHISLVAGPRFIGRFRTFLLNHSYVHELITCPEIGQQSIRSWLAFLRTMRGRRFDLCIVDPGSATVGALHGYLCGIPQRMGMARTEVDSMFLTSRVSIHLTRSTQPDLLDSLRGWAHALGCENAQRADAFTPRFPYKPHSRLRVPLPQPLIAVHVGGDKSWNRRWPLEKFTELCALLCSVAGASVCLVGGADDWAESECVQADVKERWPAAHIVNLSSDGLNKLANYLAQATLFIGNDSSPMHIAAALGKPVIVLSGPGDTFIWDRMYDAQPVNAGFLCRSTDAAPRRHYVREISCLAFRCPYVFEPKNPTYSKCLMDIRVEEVWCAALARLANRKQHDEHPCDQFQS